MDIKILDSHLREFLNTKATPAEIARYMSLCGPTIEKTRKIGKDTLYEIEVTTNRIDAASVIGIAREAAAILPRFGIKASLNKIPNTKLKTTKKSLPLKLVLKPKLVNRLAGIVIEDIKNWKSPDWLAKRLKAAGIRSLNAVVDVTNYVMITVGHPCHVFDYDKIKDRTIIVRESRKGECITSFDGKTHILPGGDIVFENTDGEIIDLPGIIGTKNSVVNKDTKKILFFFDNNNPAKIRRTSMSLAIRTMAASHNEKGVDPELIPSAMSLGLKLFKTICQAKAASRIYDLYPKPNKKKIISTSKQAIEKILGISLEKNKISVLLKALGFDPKWNGDNLAVSVPSFRMRDISIEEDIAEEIARIYGYHNLPGSMLAGKLPEPVSNSEFKFEEILRQNLKGLGGTEILTYSLVSREMSGINALRLTNPLGAETEYLRTSLKPSVLSAINENLGVEKPYHLFEIANVYIPRKRDLPLERMMLAGVFVHYGYREAKGVLETLFESLGITSQINLQASQDNYYYEYEIKELIKSAKPKTYVPIPKYPPQIEDITIEIPERKPVGEVIQSIRQASKLVSSVELVDIFERKFTFRISYLHPNKTLSNKEVEREREKITTALS